MNNLIIISFFLVRIASFTIPFLEFGLYSHYIYRLTNIFIIALVFLSPLKKNYGKFFNKFVILSFVYFFSQGLSVFGSVNISAFLVNFEKLFSSLVFLLVLYPILKEKKNNISNKLISVIIITTAINVVIELLMIVFPTFFLRILTLFLHPGIIEILKMNLQRGRIYFEFYDEISIPLVFFMYLLQKNTRTIKVLSLFLLFSIIFVSFFSNVRTRFLVTIFALLASLFIYRSFFSKNLLKIIGVVAGVFMIIVLSYKIVTSSLGFSVIDRFLLQDKAEDVATLTFRLNMINFAMDIGRSHPFFGVGLGNYYEYLPAKLKNPSLKFSADTNQDVRASLLYPHNIFAQTYAETGIFGLSSLCLLLFYFLYKDKKLLQNSSFLKKSIVLSFWSLFIFSLFNPITPLTFFSNFFVLRSILET